MSRQQLKSPMTYPPHIGADSPPLFSLLPLRPKKNVNLASRAYMIKSIDVYDAQQVSLD